MSVAWVDGLVLYRDDVERIAYLMTDHLPQELRVISVRYKGRDAVEDDVNLDEVDLQSAAMIDIAFGRVVIDTEKGKLYYNLPNGYPEARGIDDLFVRHERIAPPSRFKYLFTKPNPYRIKLVDLTRSQLRARRNDKVIPWPAVGATAGAVAAIAAVIKIFS